MKSNNRTTQSVYALMTSQREAGHKQIAVLLDPDKVNLNRLDSLVHTIQQAQPDYIFVGGSTVGMPLDTLVLGLRRLTTLPIALFPGDARQVTQYADAILFLSLLSGRNPEFLIGQQVESARKVRQSKIEAIPTAYVLIDGGKTSAVERMSGTAPISRHDVDGIVSTAMAGELLGMRATYLEAGSGALMPVPQGVIAAVRNQTEALLIVGGGLRSTEQIHQALDAGADIVVVGNHFETNEEDMLEFCRYVHDF